MTTYEVLQLLKNYGGNCGDYRAKCPCKCSRKRTLHVTAKDGITLLYCESGCRARDIVNKLGITFDDLKDERTMSWASECLYCR